MQKQFKKVFLGMSVIEFGLVRAICICPLNHKPIYRAGEKKKQRLYSKDGTMNIFSLNDCIMTGVTLGGKWHIGNMQAEQVEHEEWDKKQEILKAS